MCYFRINARLIIYAFLFFTFTNAISAKGIDFFQGSWEEASILAIQLNKPLFIEAYSDDCMLCKQIEEQTFNQEEVGTFYNDNFINVKINVDKESGHYFRQKYNVQTLPDLIFLDPLGYPIYRDMGDKDKVQLLTLAYKVVRATIEPKTALETMREQYNKGLQNSNFLYDYAYELKKHNESYAKIVNIYIEGIKKDKLNLPKNILFIYDFSNDLQTDAMELLLKFRDIFETQYGYTHIVNRIKSTALSNASKAAETNDEKLFKEVKDLIKKGKLTDEDRMIFLVESIFYKKASNWEAYISTVKSYIHKHDVRHPEFLQQKTQELLAYSHKPEDLDAAKKWMEIALIQERNYLNYDTYAHVLFKLGHLLKAESVAQKALTYSSPNNKFGLSSKSLIDEIQNYTSGTTTSFNRPIKL